MRYWHLDSADYVLMLLMDKAYYDYDYEAVKEKPVRSTKPRNSKELGAIMARFGFRTELRGTRTQPTQQKTLKAEELQAEVMAEEKRKKGEAPG